MKIFVVSPKNQGKFSVDFLRRLRAMGGGKFQVVEVYLDKSNFLSEAFQLMRLGPESLVCFFSLLFPTRVLIYLSLISRATCARCWWLTFGGDLPSAQKRLRRYILKTFIFDLITAGAERELYDLSSEALNTKKISSFIMVPDVKIPTQLATRNGIEVGNHLLASPESPRILLGNNGYSSQRHKDTFAYLRKMSVRAQCVINASYGYSEGLSNLSVEESSNPNKNSSLSLTFDFKFLTKNQYVEYLDSFDYGIFNNNRGQGFQTIIILLGLGKTLYICRQNTVVDILHRFGLWHLDFDVSSSFFKLEKLDTDKCRQNIHTISKLMTSRFFDEQLQTCLLA